MILPTKFLLRFFVSCSGLVAFAARASPGCLPHGPLEDADGLVDLFLGDDERGDPPDHVVVGPTAQYQQVLLDAGRSHRHRDVPGVFSRGRIGELGGDHQPQPAQVPDHGVALLHATQFVY
eukprot:CAMPEP_0201274936 /NCGR_PEP_ID=MMETSP0853-20130426/50987_1 /ASSEMBLY_ACC=CAM_ASM_000640 /TAXON_ID=183588 /ORGANISM="Pseudo-nitzschia fraudulenta, Strain WWA7" /LENGTH=120 /DNA_ID=CAMNT_0047582443 /DNA_START=127 /DNA_END=489 /DNA_ORIENTATION=+